MRVYATQAIENIPYTIQFDLRLIDGHAAGNYPIFGWQYRLGESYPFVVNEDRVDFGTESGSQRFGRTNLFDIEIANGKTFSWWEGQQFRITSVKPMIELI